MMRHMAWMCAALAATTVVAQEAQRLQYRTGGQPESVLGVCAEVGLRAEITPPAGLAVPKFAGDRPLFAKWITPMVPAGHLRLALDQSAKQGAYDRLYVDTNADGSLADETPVVAERAEATDAPGAPVAYGRKLNQQAARFGAVTILFPGKDGPITYHLNVTFRSRIQRIIFWTRGVPDREVLLEEFWLTPGGWHEGTVTIGGKTYTCRLADANVNGTFDDVSADEGQADFILIEGDALPPIRKAGRYVQIGGALYHPHPARNGAAIAFTPAKGVPTGTLRLAVPQAQLTVSGENGLLYLNATEGKVSAPAGKYRLTLWRIEKADGSGATWRAEGCVIPNESSVLDLGEGKEVPLAIGEPFVCNGADTVQDRGTHSLSLCLRGRLDEPVYLYRDGRQAAPPQVRIANADKTYDQTFTTEYG